MASNIDQDFYMNRIKQIQIDVMYRNPASMEMKLAWLESTRPDLIFEESLISIVVRVVYEKHASKQCKQVNKAEKVCA